MKNRLRILLLCIIIGILPSIIFADEIQLEIIDAPEYTDEYKKWLEIPDEEKSNYIEPKIYKDSVDFNSKVNKNSDSSNNVENGNLPSKFEKEYYGLVKDQENTNACWAYSATTVFESNYFFTNSTQKEFSALHMDYATSKDYNEKGFFREADTGGNMNIALAYATNGMGLVQFSEIGNKSINSSLINNLNSTQKVSDYIELKNQKQVKNYIYNYGVVSAYTYLKKSYFSSSLVDYNDDLAYCCTDETKIANHAVTIVGWDDDYINSSFPERKGAYIVLNSYGASFGNNGKYYIFYDDVFIKNGLFYGITKTNDIDYDYIYQYDEYGCVSNLTMNYSVYVANVFDRKNVNQNEQLTEISFYLPTTQNVVVYINEESKDLTISNISNKFTTEILDTGYHTIKLDEPITLSGDSFAVIVKYSNKIPIERKADSSLSWCYTATSNSGESYISSNRKNIYGFTRFLTK